MARSGHVQRGTCEHDSRCAGRAENNAESVTGRVDEDPEARLTFTWDTSDAQSEQPLPGAVRIAHANAGMRLLRIRQVRPTRRNPFGDLLNASCRRPGREQMTTRPSMSSSTLIPSTWQ